MKLKTSAMVVLCVCACIALCVGAVSELRMPPKPPEPVKVEQLVPVKILCAELVLRAIQRDPRHSENIANAFREMGRVFASMETNGNFSVEYTVSAVMTIQFPPEVPVYAENVRVVILALYRLAYDERTKANVPPLEWMLQTCLTFRDAIRMGLNTAGREGK